MALVFPDKNRVHVGTFDTGEELYLLNDGAEIGLLDKGHMVALPPTAWLRLTERITAALAHIRVGDPQQAERVLRSALNGRDGS
jgi:hypothetical protein